MISVVIPVGPLKAQQRWIGDCLNSIRAQTAKPAEVLVIDDMADIEQSVAFRNWREALQMHFPVRVWRSPWHIGVATAMNFGVALAASERVFMMSADDLMEPELIAAFDHAYSVIDVGLRDRALFYCGVRYMDDRPDPEQFIACGAAMVTKALWRRCGGFPPESASGAPDAALISIMIGNGAIAGETIGVAPGHTLYQVRCHPDQDGARRAAWQRVILESRDLLTKEWRPPQWQRFEP